METTTTLTATRWKVNRDVRPGLVLLTMGLGLFLAQLDTTAVNLALPTMAHQLRGELSDMQWVMDSYILAFAALLLTGGTLGDKFGRRALFIIGVVIFVIGSAACALAPSLTILILGRALQGLGAAAAIPQSLAILSVAFPGRREHNKAMAVWSTVAGVALAAGPLVGGLLIDQVGWRYIFWVNVPVGLAAVGFALRVVPESSDPKARAIDPIGQLLAAVTLGSLTFAIVEGHTKGWTSWPVLSTVVLACVGLVGFVLVERRVASPMLPLDMLRGQLPVAVGVTACMTFGMYGLLMLASLDFQQERGLSALSAGLWMLPLPLVFALVAPFVGRLATRYGPRVPMTAGTALMGAGSVGYALLGGEANLVALDAIFVVLGLGLAFNTGPAVGLAVSAVTSRYAGLAGGVANLARMLGAALGVAVMGTVFAGFSHGAQHGHGFLTGLRVAILIGGLVEFAGAALAAVAVREPRPVSS